MDVDPWLKGIGIHTCENLVFPNLKFILTFWRWSKFIDRTMVVSHIEIECHLWIMFMLFPTLLKIYYYYKGQHPWVGNFFSSLESYWPSTRIAVTLEHRSPFFFNKFTYDGTCAYSYWNIYESSWQAGDMDDVVRWQLEHLSSKRLPLGSLGATNVNRYKHLTSCMFTLVANDHHHNNQDVTSSWMQGHLITTHKKIQSLHGSYHVHANNKDATVILDSNLTSCVLKNSHTKIPHHYTQ